MSFYTLTAAMRGYCSLAKRIPCVHHQQGPRWNWGLEKGLNQQTPKNRDRGLIPPAVPSL